MAKDKPPKVKGIPNKHLHARTTFLYQAAAYLTLHAGTLPQALDSSSSQSQSARSGESSIRGRSNIALRLGSDLHTVSRKAQVRLSKELKRSMCKSCNAVLIPGRTALQSIENASKGGKKQWADACIIECTLCGSKKRFPVGATRQKRKSERINRLSHEPMAVDADDSYQSTTSARPVTTDHSPAST